jgi:serine/threonine protein kinase
MLDSQKDPLLTQEITVNSKLELSPEFESEINILKMCRHPNIVNFYGIWGPDKQDKLWIMMDFCVFGAVPDMIRIAEVQINEEQIKWIMKCTLLGLAYLHSKMIIHRDIKVNL